MQTEYYLSQANNYKLVTVKVIVTVLLLLALVSQIEFTEIQSALLNLNYLYLGLALLSHTAAFLLLSIRWWWLLKAHSANCTYRKIFGSYYLGLFFNNLLPTGVGGDVVRILRLRKLGLDTKTLISSSIVDRVIGLTTIVAMGTIALLTLSEVQQFINPLLTVTIVIALCLFIYYLFVSQKTLLLINSLAAKHSGHKLLSTILDTLSVLFEYRNSRPEVLASFCISLVAQHLVIITYILLGKSLNIPLSTAIYFSIVPIVFVTTSLPISIGGLGIRETTLVTLLTLFSVDKQIAITLSLIYFFLIVLLTAPGGLVILSKGNNDTFKKSATDNT